MIWETAINMDINEYTGNRIHRHPWELSRSSCILSEIAPYIRKLGGENRALRFIDIGPGDLYFDRLLLRTFPSHVLYAVDIGYKKQKQIRENIHLYRTLEETDARDLDYGLMMDSLEYMPDDDSYLRKISARIRPGGYLFFTLPAFRFLFSDHDRIVKNLRRYDRTGFENLMRRLGNWSVVKSHYFYTSLFLVRLMQKTLRLPIDPEHKVTTGWRFGKKHPVTRLVVAALNFDYRIHRILDASGIRLPGLSLFVVCQKQ